MEQAANVLSETAILGLASFVVVGLFIAMRHPRLRKYTSWEPRLRRRRHSVRQARQRGRRAA